MSEVIKMSKVVPNKNNPRFIRDEEFDILLESIRSFPSMMELRGIVVDESMVIQGGNMRFRACKELGYKEIPYKIYTQEMYKRDLLARQELAKERGEEYKEESYETLCQEFVMRDNIQLGRHDWELVANQFDLDQLASWGLEPPGMELDADGLGTGFELPAGEKLPFEAMTFKLADEQAIQLKNALEDIRATEEFKYVETFGNENGNGNALYLMVMQWVEQRK